ncbi:TonB-dependent receptor [Rhodanobacter sp. FW510-R12]|nr:TonB-dependent receptor [Rhodanobacter sp. FW104-R8]KZC28320.1 TonB-dependent receptor [Rhodanobacter sp. FW510-T8]KZC32695.1 TonB-dependent receptor [Rhodanobacter sp. FW510-R10]
MGGYCTLAMAQSAAPPAQTDLGTVQVEAVQASYLAETVEVGPLGQKKPIDVPYAIGTVNNDLARNQQLQSVREAFRYLPSVQGENIRPQSRGLQAGVVQNTRIDGMNIAATTDYPIEQFQQIEVFNGLAGALYGPASPAGTFNYVFKRPTDTPLRQFNLGQDSHGSAIGHMDFADRIGNAGRYGYRVNLLKQDGEGYVEGSNLKRQLASAGFDVHFTPTTVLENDASYYRYHTRGLPGTFSLARGVVFPSAPDPQRPGYGQSYAGDNNVTRILSSRLRTELGPNWQLTAGMLRETNDRKSTVPTNTLTSNTGDYVTTAATTTYSYDKIVSNAIALNGKWETGGLSHDLVVASNGFTWTRYIPFAKAAVTLGRANLDHPVSFPEPVLPNFSHRYRAMNTTQQSITLGDTVALNEQWSVLAAASQSIIKLHNYDKQGATTSSYDDGGASFNTGVMYRPSQKSMVYATYADSLQQGDSAPAGAINAGENLAPSRSKQWELGYKVEAGGMFLSVALFQIRRPYAYIGPDNVFGLQGLQQNRGLELSASGDIGRDFTVFAGAALLDPRLRDTGSASTDNKQVLGLSRGTCSVLVEYHVPAVKGLTLSVNTYHVTRRPGDFANAQFVDGYTVSDLGARYLIRIGGKPATLRLAADNIGNSHYWANITPSSQNGYNSTGSGTGALGAPRTIRASIQVDLL